jgi:hypothetical protein
MRVNESGNRSLRRDAEDLDRLSEPRPRMAGAARQRSARPSPEAAARRSSKAVSDEAAFNAIDSAMGDTSDDAPSGSSPNALTGTAAHASLLARFGVNADAGNGVSATEAGEAAEAGASSSAATALPPNALASSEPTASDKRKFIPTAGRRLDPISLRDDPYFPPDRAPAQTSAPAPAAVKAVTALSTLNLAPSQSPQQAPQQAPPAPTPAASPSSAATNTPQATMSAPSAPAPNERPVDAAWLQRREAALSALRADYRSALAQAQADIPIFGDIGAGWVAATTTSDINTGQIYSPTQAMLVQVNDPNAPDELMGWDEGSPIMRPHPSVWLEFSEAAFAAHRLADGAEVADGTTPASAALTTLAQCYQTSCAKLFTDHPDLRALITSDPSLDGARSLNTGNTGPAPAGFAMASAQQLGMTDLYLADPQIAALIDAYGGPAAAPNSAATSPLAQEQVRLYGPNRYQQMSRLDIAMQTVRDQYGQALLYAQAHGNSWTYPDITDTRGLHFQFAF